MTIDEAIESLKSDCEIDMYIRDIAPQLAEWLEELKAYHEIGTVEECKDAVENIEKFYSLGYKKAIVDFVNAVKVKFPDDRNGIINIEKIAEQLKAGETQ